MKPALFESGTYFTGCNYWASHAGTNMWHDWREDIVDSDLERLAKANIRIMRMFPLWNDFQPLRAHYFAGGSFREYRHGEDPLPATEAGRAGVDEVMADRFEVFCDLAKKHGITLIVGLITGWMSGRMHAPEAFLGKNLLTDAEVVRWQVKFVRYMVRRFKNHPAIAAWDLGNECNCMQFGLTRGQAYLWQETITGAIMREDSTRPVISGMHGMRPEGAWTPADQGEILDILCTHPYPLFTAHCDTDPLNQMKTVLHATAETQMMASLSGKPAFVEEIGSLGPMIASEEIAGDYVRASAFSAWAHDLKGFVWWCANEQSHLTHTPYDWNAVERELGLFRADGTKKPVLKELTALTDFVDSFEYGKLPPRIIDAVCVLTRNQDTWQAAYGSFILAKQAGLDLTFAYIEDPLPDAKAYLLPALTGDSPYYRHHMEAILEKVSAGATLYLSLNDALLSPFAELTGVRVLTRSRRTAPDTVKLGRDSFRLGGPFKLVTETVGADVIAADENGLPVFTSRDYGKGRIYLLTSAIEKEAASSPGVVSGKGAIPYYRFYEQLGIRNDAKAAISSSPYVGLTEHPVSDTEHLVTAINYVPEKTIVNIALEDGWEFDRLISYRGGKSRPGEDGGFDLALPANTGVVAVIKKK